MINAQTLVIGDHELLARADMHKYVERGGVMKRGRSTAFY